MNSVLSGTAVYLFVWLVLRISGKRTLSQVTTFDLALLLIISETTQQAMIGSDPSLTHAFLLIITLVGIDVAASLGKQYSKRFEKWMDGVPVVILENGRPLLERMNRARIDEADILAAARAEQGLQRLDQIQYAVLECNGGISIIPKP